MATRKDSHIILATANGFEIVGRIKFITDHTIHLDRPLVLPDLEHLFCLTEFSSYGTGEATFNRDTLVAEYEPSENVIELYQTYLDSEMYKIERECTPDIIASEINSLRHPEEMEIEMEMSAKVMSPDDILAEVHKKRRTKLN